MTWTTEPPTEEGWYFVKFPGMDHAYHVSHVSRDSRGRLWIGSSRGSHGSRVNAAHGMQYAGPIPEPEEA